MIVYLASPYGHTNPDVVNERMRLFSLCLVSLHKAGVTVISPLLTTVIQYHLNPDEIPELTYAEWEKDCTRQMKLADAFLWIGADGFEHSKGLAAEMELAVQLNKPRSFVTPWEVADERVINKTIKKLKEKYGVQG